MKPSAIPITCGMALAVMSAAVLSHGWSLAKFAAAVGTAPRPVPALAAAACPTLPNASPSLRPRLPAPQAATTAPAPAQKEFFESLLDEIKQLKQGNLALRDQRAETNRDLMKLEFRVDTHSESFRPLPVTEDLSTLDASSLDTSTRESLPGVLPARPVLVGIPVDE
jgi:hypothetical protein